MQMRGTRHAHLTGTVRAVRQTGPMLGTARLGKET